MVDIKCIEQIIKYTFTNKNLLVQAFVHPSYAHQNGVVDNDRMEFLGDAILDEIVSEYIYENYPQLDSGELSVLRSTIVSAQGLKPIVKQMGLLKFLLVGDGSSDVKKLGKKIEGDLFEAVLGAIYLDGGYNHAKQFVLHFLKDLLQNGSSVVSAKDYKTPLQEFCQKRKWTFEYKLVGRAGPINKPTFTCALYVNDEFCFEGVGTSIKSAEQDAAKKYCEKWRIN